MTRSQHADLLLCTAKHWQSKKVRCDGCATRFTTKMCRLVDPDFCGMPWDECASAALSEAASLGFDLETVK